MIRWWDSRRTGLGVSSGLFCPVVMVVDEGEANEAKTSRPR